ncbi:hypothetical protein Syun_031416 [Stephania yunnanensis]|uniref:valine--tRNA ligase n=1 Tax=Stephania yunnanensis TaxID=152371 RepID=A0AAP0DYG2_9MAGN
MGGGDREDVYGFAVAERARQGVHIHLHWGCQGCLLCQSQSPSVLAWAWGKSSGPSQFLGRDSLLFDITHRCLLERDFNVSAWAYGQPGIAEQIYDIALAYIDGRRQMVCSLLGGRGGAQLVTKEPSLSRRSPALQSKMGGRKMSKTLGNGIDPIDTMKEYGTDALWFSLVSGTIWISICLLSDWLQIRPLLTNYGIFGKFILRTYLVKTMYLLGRTYWLTRVVLCYFYSDVAKFDTEESLLRLPLPDFWVVSELHELIDVVTSSYERFFFGDIGRETYDFFWGDLANWGVVSNISIPYSLEFGGRSNEDSLEFGGRSNEDSLEFRGRSNEVGLSGSD